MFHKTFLRHILDDKDDAGKLDEYILLCPNDNQATIDTWENCNLGLEPPRIIVSSAAKSPNALEELKHGVLSATALYSKHPDLLRLFGAWDDKRNVLFKVSKLFFLYLNYLFVWIMRCMNNSNILLFFRMTWKNWYPSTIHGTNGMPGQIFNRITASIETKQFKTIWSSLMDLHVILLLYQR